MIEWTVAAPSFLAASVEYRELTHGSTTTPDRRALANPRLPCFAFRSVNSVGVRHKYLSRLNGWPMRAPTDVSDLPSRTITHGSGSDMVRYSFIAMDFHLLLAAGRPGASDSSLNPYMISDEPLAQRVVFGDKVKCRRNPSGAAPGRVREFWWDT